MFALAFGESLAFISLLIPAWAALVAHRRADRAGRDLNFWPVWVAGALGAALRRLAVVLGRRQARDRRCSTSGRCRAIPTSSRAAKRFVKKWGVLGIFIGRFFGPLRASVPLVAGIFEMPYLAVSVRQFQLGLRLGGRAADARRRVRPSSCSGCGT